jgi:hypothetical protein
MVPVKEESYEKAMANCSGFFVFGNDSFSEPFRGTG